MFISRGKRFTISNFIAINITGNQEIFGHELLKLFQYMSKNFIQQNGSFVTAVHMDNNSSQFEKALTHQNIVATCMNLDVFVPVIIPDSFLFKPPLKFIPQMIVDNAIYTRFSGNPQNIIPVYQKIARYLEKYSLVPTTPIYNQYVTDILGRDYASKINDTIIDIYLGVNQAT